MQRKLNFARVCFSVLISILLIAAVIWVIDVQDVETKPAKILEFVTQLLALFFVFEGVRQAASTLGEVPLWKIGFNYLRDVFYPIVNQSLSSELKAAAYSCSWSSAYLSVLGSDNLERRLELIENEIKLAVSAISHLENQQNNFERKFEKLQSDVASRVSDLFNEIKTRDEKRNKEVIKDGFLSMSFMIASAFFGLF